MKPKNFRGRRALRRENANARDAHRASLTLEERLALCDRRPGESARERVRLSLQIKRRDTPPSKIKVEDKKKREPARTDKKALKARKKKDDSAT